MQELGMIRIAKAAVIMVCSCLSGYYLLRQPFYKNPLELKGFFNEKEHCIPLEIKGFSRANIPQVELKIENTTLTARLDLGFEGGVLVPPSIMETIEQKSFVAKAFFSGLRGKLYEQSIYKVPEVILGKFHISPMNIAAENSAFSRDGILNQGKEEINEDHLETLGWRVFDSFNVLLDCEHDAIVLCDSLDTLRRQGY